MTIFFFRCFCLVVKEVTVKVNAINLYNNNYSDMAFTGKDKKKTISVPRKDMLLGALAAMAVLNSCAPTDELFRTAGFYHPSYKTIDMTTKDANRFDFKTILNSLPSLYRAIAIEEVLDDGYAISPMQISYNDKNEIIVSYFPKSLKEGGLWTPDGNAYRIDNITRRETKIYDKDKTITETMPEKEARKMEKYIKYFSELTGTTPDRVKKISFDDYLNNDRLNILVEQKDGTTLFFNLNDKKIEDWTEYNRYEE